MKHWSPHDYMNTHIESISFCLLCRRICLPIWQIGIYGTNRKCGKYTHSLATSRCLYPDNFCIIARTELACYIFLVSFTHFISILIFPLKLTYSLCTQFLVYNVYSLGSCSRLRMFWADALGTKCDCLVCIASFAFRFSISAWTKQHLPFTLFDFLFVLRFGCAIYYLFDCCLP